MVLNIKNKNILNKVLLFLGIMLLVAFVSMITGYLIALEMYKVILVLVSGVVGLFLLSLSNSVLFAILFILSMFFVGQLNYFAGIKQVVWLPYLFGLILYFKAFSSYFSASYTVDGVKTPISFWVLALLVLVIISAVINQIPLIQAILGSRDIIFLWSIFFIVAYSGLPFNWINKAWGFFPVVIAFQIPLVLYQYFIIAPQRIGRSDIAGNAIWDAVVGGFGGDPFGGGASPALAFFLVVGLVYFTSLYRKGLITRARYWFYLSLTLPSLILAEIKVVLVLIPLAFLFLFLDKLKTSFFKFFLASGFLFMVLFALIAGYEYQKTGSFEKTFNTQNLYERTIENQIDSGHQTNFGRLGRIAVFSHWWEENGLSKPVNTLFGHGVGATKASPMFIGALKEEYYYIYVDRSAASVLLWELGVLGFMLYIFILFKSSLLAFKASRSELFTVEQRVSLETTYIALILAIVMLIHSKAVIAVPIMALFVIFLVGYSVYCSKYLKSSFPRIGF